MKMALINGKTKYKELNGRERKMFVSSILFAILIWTGILCGFDRPRLAGTFFGFGIGWVLPYFLINYYLNKKEIDCREME